MIGPPKEAPSPLAIGTHPFSSVRALRCLLWLLIALCSLAQAFDLNLLPEEQEELVDRSGGGSSFGTANSKQVLAAGANAAAATHAAGAATAPATDAGTGTGEAADDRGDDGASAGGAPANAGTASLWASVRKFTGSAMKRHYSAAEQLFRKSMFLRRCIEVFKARVAYRVGRQGYIERVNKFADRSPNEIKRMFMSGPPIEFRPAHQSEDEYYRQAERVNRERSEWDAELTSKASADGSDTQADNGDDVTILSEAQAKRQIALMIGSQTMDDEEKMAFVEELRGASREKFSQASADPAATGSAAPKPSLPWPGLSALPLDEPAAIGRPYAAPALEHGAKLDWSEHECFHKIYDQGIKCGKCYVMAATTLAEFYKCSERLNVINRRQFSKDYVLDCGQKFAPTNMGCVGGSLLDTLLFIAQAGMHNIKGWRTLRQSKFQELAKQGAVASPLDEKCPLNKLETPIAQWGVIKVGIKPQLIGANQWLEALNDGPLAASVQMPATGLEGYAGGVHDGAGCATSGHWHSMVLVGYGVSDRGTPFWRFRNSWGADWGDSGHFNLAMSVPGDCLAGGVRLYRDTAALS